MMSNCLIWTWKPMSGAGRWGHPPEWTGGGQPWRSTAEGPHAARWAPAAVSVWVACVHTHAGSAFSEPFCMFISVLHQFSQQGNLEITRPQSELGPHVYRTSPRHELHLSSRDTSS